MNFAETELAFGLVPIGGAVELSPHKLYNSCCKIESKVSKQLLQH